MKREGREFCLLGLGPLGAVTRVLADDASQAFHYVTANGRPVAEGQLSLSAAKRLQGRPKLVTGLVGHPLGHSLSPSVHEAAFEATGLPGAYLPFDVEAREVSVLFEQAREFRLRGLNITIPYKETVLEFLDSLDPTASAVGSVNAVRFEDGRTSGFNTDVFGFEEALRRHAISLEGRRALVVGAGGAARAVVYALLRMRAEVAVTNRTRRRAEALARDFSGRVAVLEPGDIGAAGFDVVVNATPLGMSGFPAEPPAPPSAFDRAKVAVDLVYSPADTPFLREARARGAVPIGGLDVLVLQAARSFEIFTGKPAPLDAMFRAAKEAMP